MENNYSRTASRWLFFFGLLVRQTLFAQTAPVIQWQRILPSITEVKAVQTPAGDIITTNGPTILKLAGATGAEQWKTTLPTTYQYAIGVDLAPLPDGGVVVLARDPYKWLLIRLTSAGSVQWMNPFRLITQPGELTQTRLTKVIPASDGGYLVIGSTQFGRDGSSTNLYKFDASGTLVKDTGIGYVYSNSPRPSSVGNSIIQTPDGGYLLVGETSDGLGSGFRGWAAKLTSQLNASWQNRYESTRRFTDATNATDGQNYLITGLTTATLPSFAGILAIDPSGQIIQELRSDRQTGDTYSFTGNALIAPLPGSSPAQSVLLTTSSSSGRGNDFRFSTPGLTLSLGGSGDELVSSLIATPDGGFLLAGTTTSTDGEVTGKTDNTPSGWLVKLAPVKPLTVNAPTYDCSTGAITFNTTGGDGSPISFSAPGITRSSATSLTGTIEQGLRNDPKTIIIIATQNGQRAPYSFDLKAFCNGTTPTPTPTPTPPPSSGTLTLTQPTYTCSTGAITFNTTGGDGSTITFTAPGIMRPSITSNTGTVEQGLRNDPKTILITALQSGQTTTYSFDFKSFCSGNPPTPTPTQPPTENGLQLTAPTYNCSTGAITFNYTARNGSPVEFQAAGITGWTTNPDQFVDKDSRTANDVKPFLLMARQNGQVVTYTWDLKAACGRSARMAAEAGQGLQLTVKGNPVGPTAIVAISGVEGQAVQLDLLNANGHVLEQRHVEQAGAVDEQRFYVQQQPTGILFLRAQSGQQKQTVKLIKQ